MGKSLRKQLRQNYGLTKKDAFCGSDCCTHFCCHYCSQCQEAREIDFRSGALQSSLNMQSSGGEAIQGSSSGVINTVNSGRLEAPQQQYAQPMYYPQQPYPQQQFVQAPQHYPQQPYPQQPYPQQPYPQQPYPRPQQ